MQEIYLSDSSLAGRDLAHCLSHLSRVRLVSGVANGLSLNSTISPVNHPGLPRPACAHREYGGPVRVM